MARTGLSKLQVKTTRDTLVAQGRYPSVDAVRLALGSTGSKSTIHRFLKELDSEDGDTGARRDDTARILQTMVQQLADKLHDDAEQRMLALQADYEKKLQRKELEVAELRHQLAALAARLDEFDDEPLKAAVPAPAEAAATQRKSIRSIGFGIFGGLLSATRAGHSDASPFSKLLTGGRSELVDPDALQQSGLKFQ